MVGAPLLLILILFASCLGGGSGDQPSKKTSARGAAPQKSHACTQDDPCVPEPDPSATAQGPAVGAAALPTSSPSPTPTSTAAATQRPAILASPAPEPTGPPRACADKDITVTPAVDKAEYKIGQKPRFKMMISNNSATRCARDVGASQQELVVSRGGQRLWSSDDCAPNGTHDERVLRPGEKRTYWLTWSGKTSAPGCTQARTVAGAGTYKLTGRLATAKSDPVTFTLTS
jgi:hypothetical protein